MAHELVEFLKTVFVKQKGDTFASGEFPFTVLALAARVSATRFGSAVATAYFIDASGHYVNSNIRGASYW